MTIVGVLFAVVGHWASLRQNRKIFTDYWTFSFEPHIQSLNRCWTCLEERPYKPYIPVSSWGIYSKPDELQANVIRQRNFRQISITCFTESWLIRSIPDSYKKVDYFTSQRLDRDCNCLTRKMAVVNKQRCHPATWQCRRGCVRSTVK